MIHNNVAYAQEPRQRPAQYGHARENRGPHTHAEAVEREDDDEGSTVEDQACICWWTCHWS